MPRLLWQNSLVKIVLINQNYSFLRYIRSITKRDVGLKLVDAKVKTVTKYDDTERIESYKDFIKSIEKKGLGDEFEVEKEFLNEEYHGDVIERCDKYFEAHEREESALKSAVKKKIVGRKYFKLDRETNLLTHAAKEQIRFLHKSNPLVWNCKALSECFPISENGVKKLLKCNFVHTCPERIKEHDEKVAELWKILKSGKHTDLISPLTQKLYKEGKLIDDYFSGHPNLPTAPPSKIVIEVKKKKKIGEFSAIVQSYTEYQKQKLLTDNKAANENQVILRDASSVEATQGKKVDYKKIRQYKYASEEVDDRDPEVYPYRRKQKSDMSEIPFTQFKEILKDETNAKLKHKQKDDYDEFILKETSETEQQNSAEKPHSSPSYFSKISKYDKNKNINAMYEKSKNATDIYRFDEKLGYQHPYGKKIKNKIKLQPSQLRKGSLHKVGHCMYDDNGEFLYKVPT